MEQIQAARKKAEWSVQRLLDESGLPLERSTLQRKLAGECVVTTEECEALARALGITIAWAPDEESASNAKKSRSA